MGADFEVRERFKRFQKEVYGRLASLEARIASVAAEVAASDKYLTAPSYLDLLSRDATSFTAVFVIANAAGDFGFYYPYAGADPVNNTSILADITGAKYLLKQ